MDIKIEPPRLEGTAEEKLVQLELWVKKLCIELNLNFEALEMALEIKIEKEKEK